jgi:mannose-6-phosphate isomerase-like protein (cupin superfamily)
MKKVVLGLVAVACSLAGLIAQGDPQPTCTMCPATYIKNDEVQAYVNKAIAEKLTDQQVRAVNIGKSNVGIGVVHRGKLTAPAPESVAEHDQVSEVYHVIDGSATLVTGPDLVGKKRRPANLETVRLFNGPGNNSASIRDGVAHELKPGDVIVIPAGTGHWFTKIDDHITYLMVRIDPDKVTPIKDEAASRVYLSKPAR